MLDWALEGVLGQRWRGRNNSSPFPLPGTTGVPGMAGVGEGERREPELFREWDTPAGGEKSRGEKVGAAAHVDNTRLCRPLATEWMCVNDGGGSGGGGGGRGGAF
jgi:hypothetical protein